MRLDGLGASLALLTSSVLLGARMRARPAAMDEAIVRAITELRGPGTKRVASAVSKVGSKKSRALASLLLAAVVIDKPRRSLRLLAAGVGVAALEAAVKGVIQRPRPEPPHRMTHTEATAYPSGHAMTAAIGWTAASALPSGVRGAARAASILIGVLSGAGRVARGAHWPTDVVGGALLGSAIGVALDALLPDE